MANRFLAKDNAAELFAPRGVAVIAAGGVADDIVTVPVASATAISAGDLVFYIPPGTGTGAQPAGDETWSSDLPTTQANFTNHFLGIALDGHTAGSGDSTIRVDISPLNDFDLATQDSTGGATPYRFGDTVGPAKVSGVNQLENALVVRAIAGSSCAMVLAILGANSIRVQIASAFWRALNRSQNGAS